LDLQTLALMPPLLLAQQITTTISTRAKTSASMWYCGVAAFFSHLTWILSNAFALWQIGKEFNKGISWEGAFAVLWYCCWTTGGNLLGWKLAIWYESKYHK
jgi:hypothetical protein